MNNSLLVRELNIKDIAQSLSKKGFKVTVSYASERGYCSVNIPDLFEESNVYLVLDVNGTWYVHDRK